MTKTYVKEGQASNGPPKLEIRLDASVLTSFALLFMSQNALATRAVKEKCLRLLEIVDEQSYVDNIDLSWRFSLARAIGRATLQFGALTPGMVETRVLEESQWEEYYLGFFRDYHSGEGHLVDDYRLDNELSDETVLYLDEHASTRIRYAYLWRMAPILREIADRIDADDLGGEVADFNESSLGALETLVQAGRRAKVMGYAEAQDFSTGTSTFADAIRTAHEVSNRPQAYIKTGVQMLNRLLGGGYEGGRTYVHFGRSGRLVAAL